MEALIVPAANLLLLLILLAYFVVGPLRVFAASRQGGIRHELEEARQLLSTARAKFEDLDARLRGLGAEVQALASQSAEDARRAQSRVVQSANQLGAAIVADAQTATTVMRNELVSQLRVDLATRAIARAEEQIRARLTGEERARLRQEFSSLVEKSR
jgi:F0F1-type ATP synthase membrane subunit b/b'